MPRRPEIGNVQLYPNRPLRPSDRNGYVLKFYCPIRRTRIRRSCGTRDRRVARRVLRECRERLLNGQYVASGGAVTGQHNTTGTLPEPVECAETSTRTWEECFDRYRHHKAHRLRSRSLQDAVSRLHIAERIFEAYLQDRGFDEDLQVAQVMTLEMLQYLQDRLLAGDECRYDSRSPNTVNSMMAAVMAFVRFCAEHGWIESVPHLRRLNVDDVMQGRPVTGEEFERMLEAVPGVVGPAVADSWDVRTRESCGSRVSGSAT